MKIFLSHSSRAKPLVREVRRYLPESIRTWLDEKDLLAGDDIHVSLRDAIKIESDFLVLFVDAHSVNSEWVAKELKWALQCEEEQNRNFVLPVVLEREAWQVIQPAHFRDKKYISCYDNSEQSLQKLSQDLTGQLLGLIARDLSRQRNLADLRPSAATATTLLDDADRYLNALGNEIRAIAHPYQRDQPLPVSTLFRTLRDRGQFRISSETQLDDLIVRLRLQGRLGGLVCQHGYVFVEEEHYAWKTTIFTDEKKQIAKKAVRLIETGNVIVLDSGSTSTELAREIGWGLKLRYWNQLVIVTNSVSVVHELMSAVSELGLEDDDPLIRIYQIGGRVRPNTQAVVSDDRHLKDAIVGPSQFRIIISKLGQADIAFVGTNGVHFPEGFTTHDSREAESKAAMLASAKQKFVICDSSKFDLRQAQVFASFEDGVVILTVMDDAASKVLHKYEELLKSTKTRLMYAD